MTECCFAVWSRQQSGRFVIADTAGTVMATYPVPQTADRPIPGMLLGSGWCAFPGAEWEEEPPGRWSVAVFRHPAMQAGET
jgi:hypothetical protein